jgi:hypothetical protein
MTTTTTPRVLDELAGRCKGRPDLLAQLKVAKRLAEVLDDEETPAYVLAQASRELRAIMHSLPMYVVHP